MSEVGASRHLAQPLVNGESERARLLHHQVSSLRRASDSQDRVATSDDAFGDRMKDFSEWLIADLSRTCERDERQGEPFADDGNVAGAEEGQSIPLHRDGGSGSRRRTLFAHWLPPIRNRCLEVWMGRLAIVMLAVVSACTRDVVGPTHDAPRARASVESANEGPPPPREFGPDSYRVGAFTGQGTARPGLSCDKTSADVRTCSGFLAT